MDFYERFCDLCAEKNVAPSTVAYAIGLNRSIITYWKRGAVPKSDTLSALAQYFGVTTDYLLGKDPPWAKSVIEYKQLEKRLEEMKKEAEACAAAQAAASTDPVETQAQMRIKELITEKKQLDSNYFEFLSSSYPVHPEADELGEDLFARQLFLTYKEVKSDLTQDDLEDIQMFMRMKAERKRQKRKKERKGEER